MPLTIKKRVYRHDPTAVDLAKRLLAMFTPYRQIETATGISKSVVGRMAIGKHRFRFSDPTNRRLCKCGGKIASNRACPACAARDFRVRHGMCA